jgi:hypothetical protein
MRGAGSGKTLRSSSSAITRAASCLLANPITKSCAYLTSRACGASSGLAVCLNLVRQPLAVQLDPEAQPAHLRQELLVEPKLGRGPLRKALVARNADLVQHNLGGGARLHRHQRKDPSLADVRWEHPLHSVLRLLSGWRMFSLAKTHAIPKDRRFNLQGTGLR